MGEKGNVKTFLFSPLTPHYFDLTLLLDYFFICTPILFALVSFWIVFLNYFLFISLRGKTKLQNHEPTWKNKKYNTNSKIYVCCILVLLLSLVINFFQLLVIVSYFLHFSHGDYQIIQRNLTRKNFQKQFFFQIKTE